VKTRHLDTHQSSFISRSSGLTNRSTGAAYLWYLYVTSLALVPTTNTRLYVR